LKASALASPLFGRKGGKKGDPMTKKKWPSFQTYDLRLGEEDEDTDEFYRRWETYDREMKALIAAGGVHQDEDGWWSMTRQAN